MEVKGSEAKLSDVERSGALGAPFPPRRRLLPGRVVRRDVEGGGAGAGDAGRVAGAGRVRAGAMRVHARRRDDAEARGVGAAPADERGAARRRLVLPRDIPAHDDAPVTHQARASDDPKGGA